jgi:hypothetical protein
MNEMNPNTQLRKLLAVNNSLNPAIEFKFNDNEEAHRILNDFIKKLSDRLLENEKNIALRLENIEMFLATEVIGPRSLQYRPPEYEEYVGLGPTFDLIFEKLNTIENTLGI